MVLKRIPFAVVVVCCVALTTLARVVYEASFHTEARTSTPVEPGAAYLKGSAMERVEGPRSDRHHTDNDAAVGATVAAAAQVVKASTENKPQINGNGGTTQNTKSIQSKHTTGFRNSDHVSDAVQTNTDPQTLDLSKPATPRDLNKLELIHTKTQIDDQSFTNTSRPTVEVHHISNKLAQQESLEQMNRVERKKSTLDQQATHLIDNRIKNTQFANTINDWVKIDEDITVERRASRFIATASPTTFHPQYGKLAAFQNHDIAQKLFMKHQRCSHLESILRDEAFNVASDNLLPFHFVGTLRTKEQSVTILSYNISEEEGYTMFVLYMELSSILNLGIFPKLYFHCPYTIIGMKRRSLVVVEELTHVKEVSIPQTWSQYRNQTIQVLKLLEKADSAGLVLRRVRETSDMLEKPDGSYVFSATAASMMLLAPGIMFAKTGWMVETVLSRKYKLNKPQRVLISRLIAPRTIQTNRFETLLRVNEFRADTVLEGIKDLPKEFKDCWSHVLETEFHTISSNTDWMDIHVLKTLFQVCSTPTRAQGTIAVRNNFPWHNPDFIATDLNRDSWPPIRRVLEVSDFSSAVPLYPPEVERNVTETKQVRFQITTPQQVYLPPMLSLPLTCRRYSTSFVTESRICDSPEAVFEQPDGQFASAGSREVAIQLFQKFENCDRLQQILQFAKQNQPKSLKRLQPIPKDHAFKRRIATIKNVPGELLGRDNPVDVTVLEIMSEGNFDYMVHNTALVSEIPGATGLVPEIYAHCRSFKGHEFKFLPKKSSLVAVETIEYPEAVPPGTTLSLQECVSKANSLFHLFDQMDNVGLLFTDVKPGQTMVRKDGTHVLVDTDSISLSPTALPVANWDTIRRRLRHQVLLRTTTSDANVESLLASSFPEMRSTIRATVMLIPTLLINFGFEWKDCVGVTKKFLRCWNRLMRWTTVEGEEWPDFKQLRNGLSECFMRKSFEKTKRVAKPWHDPFYFNNMHVVNRSLASFKAMQMVNSTHLFESD